MAHRSSVQDVHRCDLCETEIVHSYCDFCHTNLCILCIGKHITDGYDKHKIVPFQDRRTTLIYPKCETHAQKNCEFQCKDCNNIVVCSSCAISKQHKGHDFVEVTEVYKTKKEFIEKDTKELENNISPTYEEIALDLENQLANLDGGYEKLTTTISKQGDEWHREINIVIDKMKTEINEIKVKHREFLQRHLNEIREIQSLMKQTLLALKEMETSNEVYPTIEYSSKIREFCEHRFRVKLKLPTFIPKAVDRKKLCSLFGQITPLSTVTEEISFSLNQPNTLVRELLVAPELVATIQTWYKDLFSVTCLNEESIWTSGWINEIKCFNIEGLLLQTIKTKSGERPHGIAVDSEKNLLYLDGKTRTVNKVRNGQTEDMIKLRKWTPVNMCLTFTDDLLISMYSDDETQSKVVRYSGFIEKQTIQFDSEGKPLYSVNKDFKYITENRNHDICVADSDAGAVVVVNQEGLLRWRYTGSLSVATNKSFRPFDITTDSQSIILTADGNNNCIHILDQNGQFIRYIDNCNLRKPVGLCVDSNENMFVCEFREGNVKKIKYLK